MKIILLNLINPKFPLLLLLAGIAIIPAARGQDSSSAPKGDFAGAFHQATGLTLPSSSSRQSPADTGFQPSGQLWGYVFGDFYYKQHSDSLSRGGSNQYTGIPAGRSAFQFRRIYLGYNYNISPKFSAELLLAAEDDFASGDLLGNSKFTFYIKYANIRWKNIWKGTDLVVGQGATPAFPLLTEVIWGYRSVERTVSDIRRTPSYDFGASLQGRFDPSTQNFGYDLMIGNGASDKPESDTFKWLYGDLFAKFFDKKLVFDLYMDYERINWIPGFHHARNMVKAFVAYNTPALTIGVEAFTNHGADDVVGENGTAKDTIGSLAEAISTYIHGTIVKGKLNFFARMDNYNPDTKFSSNLYTKYVGLTSNYEPNNIERFILVGLDFTPNKMVHFMPNIWYNRYTNQGPAINTDNDLVYRVTFYFNFGNSTMIHTNDRF